MNKILSFLRARLWYVAAAFALLLVVIVSMTAGGGGPHWTTETVSRGAVRDIVSVSGVIDAVDSAELAFPLSGTLERVLVKEGDVVSAGAVLATLSHGALRADYQDALAALRIAEADRQELLTGLTSEERDITKTTADIAREELARVKREQDELVRSAHRALLSDDLEARPEEKDNDDLPPTVSGSYTCSAEGRYVLDMYSSGARSGYSYRLSGLESGTYTAYTESAAPLGSCGLYAQFAAGESYGNGTWYIDVPNTAGASYTANLNAYNLALTERENAVRKAEQNLLLAEQNERLDVASPRAEALTRADAKVLQAQARVNGVAAEIEKHTLRAPFAGTISHIDAVPGEALGAVPVITMVSDSAFALTALIPEIDVTKLSVGQKAEIVFDARPDDTFLATIIFISPLAREIAGVSYFEAKLTLDEEVEWVRSGLNADIDIIVNAREDAVRVPRRYLVEENGAYSVLIPDGDKTRPVPVTVKFWGNDGFAEVEGIDAGTTVIAP